MRKAMSDQRVLELLRYGWLDGLDGQPMEAHLRYGKEDIDDAMRTAAGGGLSEVDERAILQALQEATDRGDVHDFGTMLAAASPYERGQMQMLQGDPRIW